VKKKLLLAGFPKSGNTWLGYMLSYLLSAKYTDLHVPDRPPTAQEWILNLIYGNLDHATEFVEVHKTHDLPGNVPDLESYDNIIHIIRDPRDVTVSYFFFQWFNLPIFREKKIMIYLVRVPVIRSLIWKMTVLRTARRWNLHCLSWLYQNAHLVRYENLLSNPSFELKNICGKLNIQRDEGLIKESITNFAFNKLSGGREPGKEDKYHFFRKGIVGDHRNYFDRVDIRIVNLFCQKTMKTLNYE
jgi:hypothetical protein